MASSITHSTIETSSQIRDGLITLGKVALRRDKTYELGVETFRKLAETFRSVEGLSPISSSRVSYLADTIVSSLDKIEDRGAVWQLSNLITELHNLKNAMQFEALSFGFLYPSVHSRSTLMNNPDLTDLQRTLPAIIDEMRIHAYSCTLIINLDPLTALFAGIEMAEMSEEFDVFMLNFARNSFHIIEHEIYVPMSSFPSVEHLAPFIHHTNPYCRLISQVLYACVLERELVEKYLSLSSLADYYLDQLGTKISKFPDKPFGKSAERLETTEEGLVYREYRTHKRLIPLFGRILEERDRCVAGGIPCRTMLHSSRLLSELLSIAGEDWREEAAQMYKLILDVEDRARRFFNAGELSLVDALIKQSSCDHSVLHMAERNSDFIRSSSLGDSYPISNAVHFCTTKEQFKLIPLYSWVNEAAKKAKQEKASFLAKKDDDFMDASVRAPAKAPRSSKKLSGRERRSAAAYAAEKERCEEGTGAGGSASSAAAAPSLDTKATSTHFSGVAPADRKAPVQTVARSQLQESLLASKAIVASWKLAPRVEAWRRSAAEGLAHYHYNPATHALSEAEMILRHRLPPQMLSLVCNELFSKQIHRERLPAGSTHYESCIFIGGNRYMVEATLDERKKLYHFYARPIRTFEDYISLLREAPEEFPELGAEMAPLDLRGVEEGITFDLQGNAQFDFEGRHYKVLLLKPFSS